MTNQRLFDLVRYMRAELLTAELISYDEYYELAVEHAAVARLEDYDGIRKKLTEATAEIKLLKGDLSIACLQRDAKRWT